MGKFGSVGTLSAVVMVASLVMGIGCATGDRIPDAGTMPEGASYSGLWYSEHFGHMYLRQQGQSVDGVYAYQTGGILEGQLEGNQLLFSWEEPGDRQVARPGLDGKGYFQLTDQGGELQLEGEWGYDDNRRGQGRWEAEFIREIKDDDPENLEQLRDRH